MSTTTRTALSRSRTLARANAQRSRGLPTSGAPTSIVNQSVTTAASQQPVQGAPGIGVRGSQPQDSLFQEPSAIGIGNHQRALVPTLTRASWSIGC